MKRYLILSDGSVFEGEAIGADGETVGEVVFTTAMVGYMETLTDPSYYGQIVAHTFPLIGNYGAIEADSESDAPALKGYVVREECFEGSNFRKESELDVFLKKHGIVGICGVDTRALTKKNKVERRYERNDYFQKDAYARKAQRTESVQSERRG